MNRVYWKWRAVFNLLTDDPCLCQLQALPQQVTRGPASAILHKYHAQIGESSLPFLSLSFAHMNANAGTDTCRERER